MDHLAVDLHHGGVFLLSLSGGFFLRLFVDFDGVVELETFETFIVFIVLSNFNDSLDLNGHDRS